MLFKATAALRTVSHNTQTGLMITIGTLQKEAHTHTHEIQMEDQQTNDLPNGEKKTATTHKRNSKHCQLPNKRLGEEKKNGGENDKNNNNALRTTAINNEMLKHNQTFEIDS